jgi:hypothetical protein
VLDAARRDEKLTGPERDIAVSHLDGDLSADNPGRTRRLSKWPVPAELALELHDPGIITNLLRSLRSATIELTVQNRTLPYGLGATLES